MADCTCTCFLRVALQINAGFSIIYAIFLLTQLAEIPGLIFDVAIGTLIFLIIAQGTWGVLTLFAIAKKKPVYLDFGVVYLIGALVVGVLLNIIAKEDEVGMERRWEIFASLVPGNLFLAYASYHTSKDIKESLNAVPVVYTLEVADSRQFLGKMDDLEAGRPEYPQPVPGYELKYAQ